MTLDFSFSEGPGHLIVNVRGEWDTEELKIFITTTRDKANQLGYTRIFIDAQEVSMPKNVMDLFIAGEYVAKIWSVEYRVALLLKPGTNQKFGETVAYNRGANFLMFTENETALNWLADK